MVRTLLERFVEHVPGARHWRALGVCAHARVTTEALLAGVLGAESAAGAFDWLRGLSFVEQGPAGLFPHDLAREVLEADLRWRDPEGYRDLHGRGPLLVRRLRASGGAGPAAGRRRPPVPAAPGSNRPFYDWASFGHASAEVPRRRAARRWWTSSGATRASSRRASPTTGWPAARRTSSPSGTARSRSWGSPPPSPGERDRAGRGRRSRPGRRLALRAGARAPARGRAPAAPPLLRRPGRLPGRGDAQHGGDGGHPALAHHPPPGVVLRRRRRAGALAPPFEPIRFPRAPEADFMVGGRRYGVFAHDWRADPPQPGSSASWPSTCRTAPPESLPGPRRPPRAALAAGLRGRRAPGPAGLPPPPLEANPLLRSRLLARADARGPPGGTLRALLRTRRRPCAAPREEKLYRALRLTYLEPAPTQERAAERLGLPFNTYRYRLAGASSGSPSASGGASSRPTAPPDARRRRAGPIRQRLGWRSAPAGPMLPPEHERPGGTCDDELRLRRRRRRRALRRRRDRDAPGPGRAPRPAGGPGAVPQRDPAGPLHPPPRPAPPGPLGAAGAHRGHRLSAGHVDDVPLRRLPARGPRPRVRRRRLGLRPAPGAARHPPGRRRRGAGAELREGFAVEHLLHRERVRGRQRAPRRVRPHPRPPDRRRRRQALASARAVRAPAYETAPALACWYFTYFSDVPTPRLEMHVLPRAGRSSPTPPATACWPSSSAGPSTSSRGARRPEGSLMAARGPGAGPGRARARRPARGAHLRHRRPAELPPPAVRARAGPSSATPAATRTRSWRWASATPCVTPSCWRRPPATASRGPPAARDGPRRLRAAPERRHAARLPREPPRRAGPPRLSWPASGPPCATGHRTPPGWCWPPRD